MTTSKDKTRSTRRTVAGAAEPAARKRAPRRSVRDEGRRQLAKSVLEQFRIIFRSAKKHFQWVEEQTGVSGAQLWVLAETNRRPGLRVSELAQAMAVHQSTASNLIDRLEKRGLIQRDRSTEDQRVVRLSLTQAGRDTVARAPLPLEGVLPNALNALESTDLAELQRQLDKLMQLMKVRDRKGKGIPLGEL